MSDLQKTVTICIGMICATFAITITSHNLTRQPKTRQVMFLEACTWNAEPLQRKLCAELAAKADRP